MATFEITESTFAATVQQPGIVLLDWWAPWCGPCRSFGPIYEKVSEKYPDVKFGKINTENEQALAAAFEIRSIPTLMVLRDSVIVYAQPGLVPERALEGIIKQIQALDMDKVREEMENAQRPGAAVTA